MDIYDITIIGAGPTGLFAAFYAGMRGLRTKVIDALPEPGGQLAILYPEKYIYDVPGYPKILAKDLIRNLVQQALTFKPTFVMNERIESLRFLDGRIIELRGSKEVHHTRAVVICAGIGAFSPNKLNVPGAQEFEGKGVFYFVREKELFRDRRVLIVGGGDSAVDWALNLKDVAKSITLIHRRDVFRAHEASVRELFNSDIAVGLFYELKGVRGDDWVKEATIYNNRTKEEFTLPVDAVLINIGFRADIGPIREWGLEIENRAIKVDGMMRTNLPGVYAAGDIATQVESAKLNLIATGFAQAAIAVNCAKRYLDPKAQIAPGHSSEMSWGAEAKKEEPLTPKVKLEDIIRTSGRAI